MKANFLTSSTSVRAYLSPGTALSALQFWHHIRSVGAAAVLSIDPIWTQDLSILLAWHIAQADDF